MAVPVSPAAAIAHGQARPADERRADGADSERDGQRQVERAELVRRMSPRVMIVPEQQQGDGDHELGNRHGGQPGPLGEPPPATGDRGRDGGEHLGGEVVVEEGPTEARAPGHRVRLLLPGAAVGTELQMSIERASGQARVFAVDPGRDGRTEPIALHVL